MPKEIQRVNGRRRVSRRPSAPTVSAVIGSLVAMIICRWLRESEGITVLCMPAVLGGVTGSAYAVLIFRCRAVERVRPVDEGVSHSSQKQGDSPLR